jgi:small subunit ribosomal protein S21
MGRNYNSAGRNGLTGSAVIVDGDFNKALRKFKKKVEESGVLQVYMAKQFYEKPTTERKRKKGAARARWLKKLKSQDLPKKLY